MSHKTGVLVYIKKNGRYLMLHRDRKPDDFHKGLWVAPGGKRESNESIIACAGRETEEETGLIPGRLKFLGFLHFPDYGNSPFCCEWVDFVFLCDDFSGKQVAESPEGTLAWIEKDRMLLLPMWEGDRIFTPYVMDERLFSMTIVYDGRKVISVTDEDII